MLKYLLLINLEFGFGTSTGKKGDVIEVLRPLIPSFDFTCTFVSDS